MLPLTHNIIDYAKKKRSVMDYCLWVNRLWIMYFHMVNRLCIVEYVKHTSNVKK